MKIKTNKLIFLISLIFISISEVSFSQDTLLLLSGDKKLITKYTLSDSTFTLNYFNKRGKEKSIDYFYIFSLIDSLGNERVFFEPSKIEDTNFTVSQMRAFVDGEYTAIKYNKSRLATAAGFVVGAGSLFMLPTFYTLSIPAVNSFAISLTKPSKKKIKEKYPKKSQDKYFVNGYIQASKEKRVNNSIKSGLVGIFTGVLSAIIYHNITK